jgi:hypothetical protein
MSGWNRLTNGERDKLSKLPVWTTAVDRQRALSYVDRPLKGTLEAVKAVSTGSPAPTNLGVLVAIARYEEAGWMPDGCFERWRCWKLQGPERLDVPALVQWLDTLEDTLQHKLRDLETGLMNQCHQQEKNLAMAQSGAALAHQLLHEHRRKLILAHLSIGDTAGAQEIAQRVPPGSQRIEIDKILHEHSRLHDPDTMGGNTITSCPDIRGALHRMHMSSERAPDIRAVPMRLVRQAAFDALLAAANTAPSPARLTTNATEPPIPYPDDLTDDDIRGLDTTAGWMRNARGAALTEDDQQRVGQKIEKVLAELRRHRATPLRLHALAAEPDADARDTTVEARDVRQITEAIE